MVDCVLGALAQIAPKKVMAAGEGGNTVIALSGYAKGASEPFILVDMINGAWGGRFNKDGVEGVTNPSQNMSNMPIETLEARYPIVMEAYGFATDSGGAGEYRGGLGLVREYRIEAEEVVAQIRSDRANHAPYGLFGGGTGACSANYLRSEEGLTPLPSKFTRTLHRGAIIRHEQAGGGGYGDPLTRTFERIEADLANGKITRRYAEERHNVVFDGDKIDRVRSNAARNTK